MQKITVEIKKVKVASFSAAKQEASFVVLFSDGKEKEVTKVLSSKSGGDPALEIIKEIRKVEGSLNEAQGGKAALDSYVNVLIKSEDKVTEKISVFASKVFDKINAVKNQKVAEGYVSLINHVNSMKLEL